MKLLLLLFMGLSITSQPTKLKLEDFVFSQEQLPKGCSFKVVSANDQLPCNAGSNPFVSSDPTFINCFAGMMLRNEDLVQKVHKALFSVYQDTVEIGVFGVEANSEETALQILSYLESNASNDEGSSLIQSGAIVILLWQDHERTPVYDSLKNLIEERME